MIESFFTALFFASLFSVLASSAVVVVPQAHAYIIQRFGRYSRTMTLGLNFRIPLVDVIHSKVDCRVQQVTDSIETKLSDEAFVSVPVTVLYSVKAENAASFTYKIEDPTTAIKVWLAREVRSAASSMSLPDMYSDRSKIRDMVMEEFTESFKKFGVTLEDFVVDVPVVDEHIKDASNKVIASRRLREAAEFEAEAKRIRMVGEARAESESQVLRADGISKARKILADGLANSLKEAGNSGLDQHEVMNMLVEMARLDTIRATSEGNGKIVVMDLRSPGSLKPTIEI